MTVGQIIAMADSIKPNPFETSDKLQWLNECEGLVQTDIYLMQPEECVRYSASDTTTPVLAPAPYDKLYWIYVSAMIDFSLGEYSKYQNSMNLFNAHFGEYQRWYANRYKPADTGAVNVQVFSMIKGTTPILEFTDLPATDEEMTGCDLYIKQGGTTKLHYDEDDEEMSYVDDTLTCSITAEDSATLSEGLALVSLVIETEDSTFESYPQGRIMVYPSEAT